MQQMMSGEAFLAVDGFGCANSPGHTFGDSATRCVISITGTLMPQRMSSETLLAGDKFRCAYLPRHVLRGAGPRSARMR